MWAALTHIFCNPEKAVMKNVDVACRCEAQQNTGRVSGQVIFKTAQYQRQVYH